MRIDNSWLKLIAPDFTPFTKLDPKRSITLTGADVFFGSACLPKHVIEATKKALDDGHTHYSLRSNYAEPVLEDALIKKLREFNGLEVDPATELIVVPSSAYGLFAGIRVCIRPNSGDEVINFDPGFSENFNDVYQMGAVDVRCPLYKEKDFIPDMKDLENCITERTRVIVLTHPNNPTGKIYDRTVMEGIAELARKYDLAVVVDQDFERNIFDGKEYITFATLPGMRERTITVFGTSKDLGLTGFRVAYMVAPPQIIQILKPATFNYMGPTTTFSQYGVAAGYNDSAYVDEWMKIFAERREKGYKILNQIPGLDCPKNDAGFYFWADCSKLGTDMEIVEHLINDAQIGVGPGSWFGDRGVGFLRIMYGRVPTEALYEEALERMYNSLVKLSK